MSARPMAVHILLIDGRMTIVCVFTKAGATHGGFGGLEIP